VNELADRVAVMYAGQVVEQADRETILGRPLHPYTQGLLRSMPARSTHGARLPEIPGVVPSPAHWPKGCRFADRCERRLDVCTTIDPESTAISETHVVHCHAVARDVEAGSPTSAAPTSDPLSSGPKERA
jgi:oligopeptide/dipeptide ABC transporter ATP-binding protein